MIRPEKIISCVLQGNTIKAECGQGIMYMVPYATNILHFVYDPEGKSGCLDNIATMQGKLPMWGIEAQADKRILPELRENEEHINCRIAGLGIELNKSDAQITFFDINNRELLTLMDCVMDPVVASGEKTFRIRTVFSAGNDEKFYGLGQHQDGKLDLGGKEHIMWHDYSHKGGEIVAIPFLITSKKYGLIFDNPSRSKVTPGVEGKTIWEAEAGDLVSFFFITGEKNDDIYCGYRRLCGSAPLPPRRGLGFIQCKQRYASQKELLEVASQYRDKGYPCDIFVVDWFHWKVLGDLSLDTAFWPDSAEMNRELEALGYETMISCWPRFMKGSSNYDFLEKQGWFMKDTQGNTVYGTMQDQRGALIDTTNPECGKWYFETIKRNYCNLGYKYYWTDENEPDISPHEFFLYAGSGICIHNIYPLTHTRCIYEGHRKSYTHRCLILSRASYLGAQKYGTTFWSSDIFPEWDVLRRQIPTALNFCASGMPYWSSDIGGWQALPDEDSDEDYSKLLIQTSGSGIASVTKKNYTELYIRWFQFGVFCPTFRTHGTRKHNEVWSYGEEAEKILVKYLRLRYRLMPYIYSLAYQVTQTGAPFMRALWMDFSEEECGRIEDEFMFGPALLVAPVVEQGAVSREVYLPGGTDWYNFWTNEKLRGGQTVMADAPVDTLPLYVKLGSIIPMGEVLLNSKEEQEEIEIRVYPGKQVSFLLYSDDGMSYAYEKGEYSLVKLIWEEDTQKLQIKDEKISEKLKIKKYKWVRCGIPQTERD